MKIDWKNHAIELVVVFIGITAAFMLNNWRETAADQKLESQYIQSFSDDLKYDAAKLDTMISINKRKTEKFKTVIERLARVPLPADSLLVIVSEMVQISLFVPKTNTYESLKNSGNFGLVAHYDVRAQLIEYYQSFEGKKLVEEYYRMYLDNYVIPFLFENVDIIHSEVLPTANLKGYRLNNLVVGYYQLLTQVLAEYEKISKLNTALQLKIDAQKKE